MKKIIFIVMLVLFAVSLTAQIKFFTRLTEFPGIDNVLQSENTNYYGTGLQVNSSVVAFSVVNVNGGYIGKKRIDTFITMPFPNYDMRRKTIKLGMINGSIYFPTFKNYFSYQWLYTPCMVKIDTNGNRQIWDYTFNNPTTFDFYDNSVDDFVFAQGETNRDTLNTQYLSSNGIVMKIDTAGNEIWRYTYNTSTYANRPAGITATADSGCVAVFVYGPWPAYSNARLVKLNKNGVLQWMKTLPVPTGIYTMNLISYNEADSSVVLFDQHYHDPNVYYNFKLYKINSNMQVEWAKESFVVDSFKVLEPIVSPDSITLYLITAGVYNYIPAHHGGYIGFGSDSRDSLGKFNYNPTKDGAYLRRISESGQLLWEATYNKIPYGSKRPTGYLFTGINTTSDGGYILSGSCYDTIIGVGGVGNQIGFLMKIDSLGCLTADSCETHYISSIHYYEPEQLQLSIYPNPSNSSVHVSIEQIGNYELSFYNLMGQKVYNQEINIEATIDVSAWTNGVYFYTMANEKGIVGKGKLIVE